MLTDGTALAAPMGSLTYRYLIQPDALACVAKDALIQFLRPHEDWCAAQGLLLETLEHDPPTLERLHTALTDPAVERPEDLVMALCDLGGLAGRWGCAEEVARVVAARASGGAVEANVIELAFREYLRGRGLMSVADQATGRLVQRLVEFVCFATGGPCVYSGRDMKTVHQGMKITGDQFSWVVGHLVATLEKFKVPAAEKNELLGLLGPTRGSIVEE